MDIKRADDSAAQSTVNILTLGATAALAVVPPLLLRYSYHVAWRYLFWGGLTWLVSILIKFTLASLVHRLLPQKHPGLYASTLGFLSALSELGVAGFVFQWYLNDGANIPSIIAFAMGAGCTEILFVLAPNLLARTSDAQIATWVAGARQSMVVRHLLFIERLIALVGHIGSRGVVCVAIAEDFLWAAFVVLVTFALTDGLTVYGDVMQWNWHEPRVCHQVLVVYSLMDLIEIVLLAWICIAFL